MNSVYQPSPLLIDPFVLHFLSSTIQPPPPLPSAIFFFDPLLVVPPPPSIITSPKSPKETTVSARRRYTPIQLFILHRIFNQLPYPSLEQRRLIAEHLHIDVDQVRIWFSNRRSRRHTSNHSINLIRPTSNEYLNFKELFEQLKLVI